MTELSKFGIADKLCIFKSCLMGIISNLLAYNQILTTKVDSG